MTSLTVVACGGGGGGGTAAVPSVATAAPTTSTTTTPASGTTIGSSGTAVSASGATGVTTALTVSGSGVVNATSTTTAPFGLAALASAARKTGQSLKTTATTTNTPLVYVQITAASASTLSGLPAATFTFASAPVAPVYLAYYSGSAWVTLNTTPGTITGNSVTFSASTFANPITLAVNASVFIAVYTGGILAATPASSPTPTATASPTAAASGTPFPTGTANPLVSFVNSATFFSTTIPNGGTIVLSAWDLSSDVTTALTAAAHNGHTVTVITPYSEHTSNDSDVATIVAAGGSAIYEYTSSQGTPSTRITYQHAPMDIHAKFAIIDGVAYMDGHNWFTTDAIVKTTNPTDISAINTDLTTFPAAPPNGDTSEIFTTDKQVSLKAESDFIQNVALPALANGSADEFNFITESYNSNPAAGNYNDDVAIGQCQIAALPRQPKLRWVFEQESGYSTASVTWLQNILLLDPSSASTVRTNNNGHEKISMIRKNNVPLAAWFGSSNATTTDLFDWGMVTYDPAILNGLASYFDTVEFPTATAIGAGSSTTPTACGSVHS